MVERKRRRKVKKGGSGVDTEGRKKTMIQSYFDYFDGAM